MLNSVLSSTSLNDPIDSVHRALLIMRKRIPFIFTNLVFMDAKQIILFVLITGIAAACLPYEEEISEVAIDLKDEHFQKVFSFQDKQLADSLFPYFYHDNPSVRFAAISAFGSIKEPMYTDTLASLLDERNDLIKAAAAYAIGQSCGTEAESLLIQAFDRYDTSGYYRKSNRAILEAIGKCGSSKSLEALSSISTYNAKDTLLLEGQTLGIFRYLIRDITSYDAADLMVKYLTNNEFPESVQLIAAHYLSRIKDVPLDTFAIDLAEAAPQMENPNIILPYVLALGKTKRQVALDTLTKLYDRFSDPQIISNIIVALSNFEYSKVQALMLKELKNENPYIAQRAGAFFVNNGIPQDATFYWRTAKDTLSWPVQVLLYQAANKHLPPYFSETRGLINYELRRKFNQATTAYEKVAILNALAEFPWNYRFIHDVGYSDSSAIIKSASVQALSNIGKREDFEKVFRSGSRQVTRELSSYFKEAIETNDIGMAANAALAFQNKSRNYQAYLDSLTFIETALSKTQLPEHIETYNALQDALSFLQGTSPKDHKKPVYNHDMDWSILENLEGNPIVAIKTSKGTIVTELFPKNAPATVASFVDLIQNGYYNGKNFHRVVPNFVIQGGCTRGDGYGATDFTLRSELSPELNYHDPGYLGMASSGPHTEGTQFFITQAPTPHLDGRYTIFGKVVDGLDIVNKIEVGDEIENISLRYNLN